MCTRITKACQKAKHDIVCYSVRALHSDGKWYPMFGSQQGGYLLGKKYVSRVYGIGYEVTTARTSKREFLEITQIGHRITSGGFHLLTSLVAAKKLMYEFDYSCNGIIKIIIPKGSLYAEGVGDGTAHAAEGKRTFVAHEIIHEKVVYKKQVKNAN